MMFCKKCGSKCSGNIKNCPVCGDEIADETTEIIEISHDVEAELTSVDEKNSQTASTGTTAGRLSKRSTHIIIILILVFIIIASGVISAVCLLRDKPDTVLNNHITAAEKYFAEMNYDMAIVEYNIVLKIDPKNIDAWINCAYAYEKTGDIDKAIDTLERALEFVDDERVRVKLEELKLIKNPPVVTEAPKVEEQEAEIVDNGYVEYETVAVSEVALKNLGAGVNYIKNEDSTYTLYDLSGNRLTDENYMNVYTFFESECGNYAVLCPDESTCIIVNDRLETVIDISGAYNWKFFDKVNGLVAVTYSGTVTKRDSSTREEYQEEEKIAHLEIYKLDTAELLYRWNYGDWIEGENTEIDLNKIESHRVSPDEMYCESCGGYLAIDYLEIYIDSFYGDIETYDNRLRIPFNIYVNLYVTNMDEIMEELERENERHIAESGGGLVVYDNNTHGHADSVVGFYEYYEAVYENGKIIINESEANGIINYSDEEYAVYNTNDMPIPATILQLSEDNRNSYFWHSSEFSTTEDGLADEFEWIVNVYKNEAIGGRNTSGTENSIDLAFFKPVWYSDSETAKEKGTSEWVRISEWFSGITNYGVHKDGYWLRRYKENSTEEKEYAVFGYNGNSDSIEQLSDWYDSISWDESEYSLVGKDGKFGYIDSKGKEIKMYDDASNFVNGYAMIINDGKAIIVDEEFNQCSEEIDAESVSAYGNDLFRIEHNDKFTYIRISE